MSENSGGYYCVNNCLHSFKSTNKLELHEDVIKDHEYYHIKMSEEHKNILKFNQEQNFLRILYMLIQNPYSKNTVQ